ncbi:phosphotransferase [Litchfieldia alkalitelluris]|uniref:phosphotransferase n=1 Tax=Litchfieldia alkalitelluris TaxID=304268 RepID=UPI00099849AF|nr:phosphotransferase [Litchfieldia alkalitelluris]
MYNNVKEYLFTHYNLIIDKIWETEQGANNKVLKVNTATNENFVMKLIEEHLREKLSYEHKVLNFLSEQNLSFNVPAPIKTKYNKTFFFISEERTIITLYPFCVGHPLTRNEMDFQEFGICIGELLSALENVKNLDDSPYLPTFEIFTDPALVNGENWKELLERTDTVSSNEIAILSDDLNRILTEVKLLKNDLPIQIIHGDMMASNLLWSDGQISSILDF